MADKNRLVCKRVERTNFRFHFMETPARGTSDRCLFSQLEEHRRLPLSPILPHSSLSSENKERRIYDYHGMPYLAKSTLVPSYFRIGLRHTENLTTRQPTTNVPVGRGTSTSGFQFNASRLEAIRISLISQRFSSKTVEILLAGNRTSTLATYESAWNNWNNWCAEEHQNPMSNDLRVILSFLTSLHVKGKSYSTINIHRSMLSMTLKAIDNVAIGQHPMVLNFMKGCYNLNPPRPRYSAMWDVQVVLNFMREAGNNSILNLSIITKKLATLLAISTLLRVSELASLNKISLEFSPTGARIALSRPRKAQSSGPLRWVSIDKYEDGRICPVDCLRTYIYLTDFNRNEGNQRSLFISLIEPFGPVSGNTIGRWIKTYLSFAGINTDIFSAHSTRGAAASGAVRSGVPIDSILRTGDWSNESTFAKYYNRQVTL